jgi:fermentation-respiration switch protein FrsA (DUF1100 family)
MLILHGDADQRVPMYQGRQFFEALLAHGKTARMVAYPGSGPFPREVGTETRCHPGARRVAHPIQRHE